jgi:hypothetical protein
VLRCDLCGERHANGECMPKVVSEDANYIGNYQKGDPCSNTYNSAWAQHPNLKYLNNNTLNLLIPPPQPQPQRKPSAFEEAVTTFVKTTQNTFQEMKVTHEASMKNLENQIEQLAKQITN